MWPKSHDRHNFPKWSGSFYSVAEILEQVSSFLVCGKGVHWAIRRLLQSQNKLIDV